MGTHVPAGPTLQYSITPLLHCSITPLLRPGVYHNVADSRKARILTVAPQVVTMPLMIRSSAWPAHTGRHPLTIPLSDGNGTGPDGAPSHRAARQSEIPDPKSEI